MLYIIILRTSSITHSLPCVVYNHSLDKQYYSPLTQCCIQSFSGQAALLSPYPVLNTIFLWTSSITLPLPSVVCNYSLDTQYNSPLTLCWIQLFSGQAVLLSPYPVLNTIILWTSSITLPFSLCWIQSFSGQAALLSPYPVLNTIILWTSSITLPLPCVEYNHSLDKQYYSPHCPVLYTIILWTSSITLP